MNVLINLGYQNLVLLGVMGLSIPTAFLVVGWWLMN